MRAAVTATAPDGRAPARPARRVARRQRASYDARWRLVADAGGGDRRHRAADRRRARRPGADALPRRRQRGARRVAGHGAHPGRRRGAVGARPRRLVLDRLAGSEAGPAQRRGRARRPGQGRARPADARALPAGPARGRRHRPVVRTGEPQLLAEISDEQVVAGASDTEHLELLAFAGPLVALDRAAARPRARPRRDHARAHGRARATPRTMSPSSSRWRPAPRSRSTTRACTGRHASRSAPPARRGPCSTRWSRRRPSARASSTPIPLHARQRRAGRDQRRAGDRPRGPQRARGAARRWPRRSRPRSPGCWPRARRSSTCSVIGETPREPGRARHYSPATTGSRFRAAGASASASPSPTSPIARGGAGAARAARPLRDARCARRASSAWASCCSRASASSTSTRPPRP